MAEQQMTQTAGAKDDLGFRCRLLLPVMQGNKLESDDVCSFLAGRLSTEDEEEPSEPVRVS